MRRIASMLAVVLAGLFLVTAQSQAAGKTKAKKGTKVAKLHTVKGEVVELTNKKGRTIGVTLKEDGGKVYKVVFNLKGKQLAKKLAGKKAEVSARVIRKGTKKKPILWLRVMSFKALQEAPAAAEPEEENVESEDEP